MARMHARDGESGEIRPVTIWRLGSLCEPLLFWPRGIIIDYSGAMILHRIRTRVRSLIAFGGAAVLLATMAQPAHAAETRPSDVARRLQETMAALRFGDVLDTTPPGSPQARSLGRAYEAGPTRPERAPAVDIADTEKIHQQPQVDTTVIELDRSGRPVSSGT